MGYRAFSLIELVIVLALMAVIIGIGAARFNALVKSSRLYSIWSDLNTAEQAVLQYSIDTEPAGDFQKFNDSLCRRVK